MQHLPVQESRGVALTAWNHRPFDTGTPTRDLGAADLLQGRQASSGPQPTPPSSAAETWTNGARTLGKPQHNGRPVGSTEKLKADFETRAKYDAREDAADPGKRNALKAARQMSGISSGQLAECHALFEHEIDVTSDWLEDSVVMVFQDEAVLVLRFDESGEAGAIHPIGECRRCNMTVPLGPSVTDTHSFGRVLKAGVPVGHDCPGAPIPSS